MNKLEELGGLEAVKAEAKERDRIPDGQLLYALIEHIESLTSEREALKKRVEEFEQDQSYRIVREGFMLMWNALDECFSGKLALTDKAPEAVSLIKNVSAQLHTYRSMLERRDKQLQAAEKRVEELERERNCPPFDPDDLPTSLEMNEDGSVSQVLETVGGDRVEPFMERVKVLEAQLQAARLVCAKARDFLLEGK